MKGVSLRAGLNETAARDVLKRGQEPGVDTFIKLAEAAGVSPVYLLLGDSRFRHEVPVIGHITGWHTWEMQDAADKLDLDLTDRDAIAISVRDDTMSPVYRAGDLLICHRRHGRHADNLVGLDCVIETREGKRLIGVLQRGTRPGRFRLRTYSAMGDDFDDIQIAWAAPVAWIKRAGV